MKIFLDKNPSNITLLMRRLGYHSDKNQKKDALSFSKRLQGSDYPKYHIYINKTKKGKMYLHLHLDMKKPSYKSSHAHNAEYEDNPWLDREAERIKAFLNKKRAVDN